MSSATTPAGPAGDQLQQQVVQLPDPPGVDRALVRTHADDHTSHECLPAGARWNVEQEGQRYFEPSRPRLSLSLFGKARPAQATRATRQVVGRRSETDGPDTWTEPCADTVLIP